ncbi:MAG: site-2 protease family protein [Clostridia bacterium]|nr:site-2 protease family protein [Clostridia bacterium]
MISRIQNWFGNGWLGIVELLITALCVFLSLSVHEFGHGYVAYKMGDNTARYMGRLNINPLSHLDPIGAICLFLFGFGWAKPVPVNPRNFKSGKFKSGMVWTSLAGPLSNIILAFFAVLFLTVISKFYAGTTQLGNKVFSIVVVLLSTLVYMNINLAVFNLLPVPPLDGSKILNAVLPSRIYFKIMQYEQYGFVLLIILINTPLFGRVLNFLSNLILTGIDIIIGLIPFL